MRSVSHADSPGPETGGPVKVEISSDAVRGAFLDGVRSVFEMMLDLSPDRGTVELGADLQHEQLLTVLIGISGELEFVVVLRFPEATALDIAGRFSGAPTTTVTSEVVDAISELANMVAGSAKAAFDMDPPLELSLPTVVHGDKFRLRSPREAIWVYLPFACEAGVFQLDVAYSAK